MEDKRTMTPRTPAIPRFFSPTKLKSLLTANRVSIEGVTFQLASRFGHKLTGMTIRNYVAGKTQPNADTLYELCQIFNVPLDYWFQPQERAAEPAGEPVQATSEPDRDSE